VGNGTFYRTTDHLGSTRLETDASGAAKWCRDYEPFGEEIPSSVGGRSGANCYGSATAFRQKFTGKERDGESGLDYFLARYYSSPQGRFTSPDPLVGNLVRVLAPQRWNAYAYAVNNPNFYIDPNGLDAIAITFPKYRVGSSGVGLPLLGHAGIVVIKRDGSTTYRDYGRYGTAGGGKVRVNIPTPTVQFGANGLPTKSSITSLMRAISLEVGNGGPVDGAYFRATDAEDQAMIEYVKSRVKDPGWPYHELYNNCQTFCVQTLFAGGQLSAEEAMATPYRPISAIYYLRLLSSLSIHYEQTEHDRKRKEKVDVKCNGIEGCEKPQ
jgi:RHS repeat-associated protein